MTEIQERGVVQSVFCEKPFDNSRMILKGFWEQRSNFETKPPNQSNVIEDIISIIDNAVESIYLYSPKITHAKIRLALEKKREDGIRIYAITSSIKPHLDNKLFSDIGIMREKKDISSTFVISDPKNRAPIGVWFKGELTSEQDLVSYFLILNGDQAKEAWAYFSHSYWKANGEELYFDRIRDTKTIKPAAPQVKEVLSNSFQVSGIDSVFGSDEIYELWLLPDFPQELNVYCSEVKKCVLQVHEKSKNILEYFEGDGCDIFGTDLLPFCLAKVGMKEMVMSSDVGFILTHKQKDYLHNLFQLWQWQYRSEKLIKDVYHPIILNESDWTKAEIQDAKDFQQIKLGNVISPSIEDWQNFKPENKIPELKPLAKKICYKWTLEPPSLPEGSKKHKLYDMWDYFSKELNREISELKKVIDIYRSDKGNKGITKITTNKKLSEIEGRITQIEKELNDISDTSIATDIIKRLNLLKQDLSKFNSENKDEGKLEENELETLNKSKHQSKKRTNELEALRKNNKSNNVDLSNKVPSRSIPSIGMLYENGNNSYLVIRYIDEIEEGVRIAKEYHAKLVAT